MWIFSLLFGITVLHQISCQCTFPATLTGTWVSSNDGTWDINSTHLLNYYSLSSTTGNTIVVGVSQLDFTCFENRGDTKYAIMSEAFTLFDAQRSVYTCIDIREISENKLLYYHATEADPSGLQFTIQSNYDDICNLATYENPYNYHVALKSGAETTALQNCPSNMFGSYNYDTCIDVNSNSTSLDVCDSRQQVILNYTLCNTPQLYTLEGVLDCVHHEESGSISYLTLYNRDSTTPDNSNYFQYVCLAVELSGSTVYLTARPNRCNDNQNATAIGTPGQALQLTPYYLCPITTDENKSSSFNFVPIIIGVVALLLLAIIALIIYCCCCRRKCMKKEADEEEAKSEPDKEDEQKKSDSRQESRRSSKSSLDDEEETNSVDSGISEPPVTARTDSNIDETEGDTKEQEKELVINAEGDKEIEDKTSRPRSGQGYFEENQASPLSDKTPYQQQSRMSDLPPSTIPPDEDHPLSHRSEEDLINDENKTENVDNEDQVDTSQEKSDDQDKMSEKADDSDHEPEKTGSVDDDEEEDIKSEPAESEPETVNETEKEQEKLDDEKDREDDKGENEAEKEVKSQNVEDDNVKQEKEQDEDEMPEDEDNEKEETEPETVLVAQKENDEKEHEAADEEHHHSDSEMTVDNKGEPEPGPHEDPKINQKRKDLIESAPKDHGQTQEGENQESQEESDAEEKVITRKDKTVSSDEDEIQRKLIGGKKGKDYLTKGALTTVLVSREEEERKRQKLNGKTKSQKMRKMAKKKTRRFGGKGDKIDKNQVDGDEFCSSDDEIRRRGPREAPFMKQYEDKKHIQHILEEQHYWSDPERDNDAFRINDDMSSIFRSDYSSESEEEIIGADGIPIRVKKTKREKRKKRGDGDDISNADSEYLRQKMIKRAGSVDSMVSVEDPDNIDQRKSKRRLNEHVIKTDSDEEMANKKNKLKTTENRAYKGASGDETRNYEGASGDETREYKGASGDETREYKRDSDDLKLRRDDKIKTDASANTKFSTNKAKTIIVKEHSDMKENLPNGEDNTTKRGKRAFGAYAGKENDDFSDFCDSDIDKISDRDSGMDDEDGDIDVLLTPDQQQMIVNMLFDEEMNLRPQFSRDGNGRIVRRLDNTVVFDPHTGRFTYRKRLGQIFKVPRLKRNDKGRPLGGYIDDDFGPKNNQVTVQRKTSSARRSQSGKSGRVSLDIRSPSADLKRTRTDGRNVGFSVPDEDIDTLPDDQLEYNKRGRRDIGSAIRRKLNKRLFKKKRKPFGRGSPGILPEVKVKKAWADDQHHVPGSGSVSGPGGVSPLNPRSGRFAQSSPWPQRKTHGPGDAEQLQMYREGLQSDRRILEGLQDKLYTRDGGPFAPKEAFVEPVGEGDQADHNHGEGQQGYERGNSYMTDDGRVGIRERGCPELKKTPLFTIVRRPGDLESQDNLDNVHVSERHTKSAPLNVEDYNEEQTENEQKYGHRYTSDTSLLARSHDGRFSQMTSIDDNRLRRLLEELYKDKKYFDNYIESKDPTSKEFVHSQGLAEHGRGFLLKRADFWERRGPLPPRPPMTDIGCRMQRQQTMFNSRQTSELGGSTATCSPDISTNNMPGAIESPRNETINEENDSRDSPTESYA